MTKRFLLLAVFICKHLMMFSQFFFISGKVTDEQGNGLPGANVIIEYSYTGASTNQKGEFSLRNIRQGNYNLVVSYLGYETVSKPLLLNNDTSVNIRMVYKPYLADEVIVRATRADNNGPIATSAMPREDIRNRNTGQDIPYLLALTPSVITTSDAGAGVGYTALRIRGTDMTGINVTINGIPINDAESHLMYWVDLPDIAASADNIQIQRGVGTSTIGSGAFGATINLQTLGLNKQPYAEINNAYGSFNTWRNSVSFGSGLINDHFSFDGRLSKISSDGYIDRAWSNLKSFYLSGSYYAKKTLLKINVFSGSEHTYQAWDGVPDDSLSKHRTYNGLGMFTDNSGITQFYKNQTDNYQQDHFHMFFSHSFSSSLNLNAALHYTIGKGYYEEYKEGSDLTDYGLSTIILPLGDTIVNTNLIRQKWLDNVFYGFTWSANYTKNKIKAILGGGWNQYYGKHFGNVIWAQYMSNGQMDHQYYKNHGTKNDFNVFAKTTYLLTDYLSVFGDIQFRRITHSLAGIDDSRDITQSHNYNFINPKIGVTLNLGDHTINGYYGIAQREPTRDDFVDADASNPVPGPELLKDLEIGYSFRSEMARVGINYYYMDYKDQLILTGKINDVGSAILTNVDKSYRTGIEFTGGIKFLDKVNWSMNATLSKNIIKNFVSYTDNYDTWPQQNVENLGNTAIAFSPSIIAGSQISYDILKTISIHFISKYVDKQYIDNTQNEDRKLKPYFLNDIRINGRFKSKFISSIEPFIMINNFFDVKYETNAWVYQYIADGQRYKMDGYFPQAGINFMVGLSLRF
jgi:iron complex outermembrane recepter protein